MSSTDRQQQQQQRWVSAYGDEDDDLQDLDDAVRNVRFSDRKLVHMALSAAQQIDWDALSSSSANDAEKASSPHWTPYKSAMTRHASTRIYTRRSESSSLAVLAHTTIPCSLHELKLALETPTSEAFCDLMRVLFRSDFLSGELVHAATTEKNLAANAPPELLVKAIAFENQGLFFGSSEEWCYLDFAQQVSTKSGVDSFRKTIVAVNPEDCFTGRLAASRASQGRDVVAGLLLEEEPGARATRLTFSGEYNESISAGRGDLQQRKKKKKSASSRTVKARLLKIAESVERLNSIIRRRRLGMQVLIDQVHVKPTNKSCIGCRTSFLFTRKRICHLCGYNVCEKCSAMEDRERRSTRNGGVGRPWIVQVRICDKCIVCVDQCTYLNMATDDLMAAGVVADPSPREPLGVLLTDLLQSKLQEAQTDIEKANVLGLVKAMLDEEKSTSSTSSNSSSSASSPHDPVVLVDPSAEPEELFKALQSKLNAGPALSLSECVVSDNEKRSYRNEHPLDPVEGRRYVLPSPASEAKRLEAIRSKRLTELINVPELDVLCSIAAKELGCVGTMVAVVEEDFFHVVATDMEIPTRRFPRYEGFCSRTILDDKPLLVPHLQADVRFSHMEPVNRQNLGFYCGFPLFAEDFTVIGSLCCAGLNTHKLTQSEFVIAKKLAYTASKILRTRGVAADESTSAVVGA